MGGGERDAGLVRAIGTWGLAANLVTIIVGAGIFAVPGALAAFMGPYAPVAFVICGIAVGAVALCFAEGGSRIPTSGGAYGYIDAAFGPRAGYVAGMLLWLGDVLACGGVAAALADATVSLLPSGYRVAIHSAVIVAAIGIVVLVNLTGVAQGARLVNVATLAKLIPLAIFIVVGAWAAHASNFAVTAKPDTRGLGRGLLLALFALTGMEGSLNASGEVKQPTRTIPRALAIAITSAVLLYVAIQIISQGILGPSLALSRSPLADAMARISPTLRVVIVAGAAVSMFGWISGDLLATPRMLFAFARDGLLPRALGRVHPRSRVPHIAIVCYAAIALVLALTGTFAELAVLAALASAALYIGGCAAAWRLQRKDFAVAGAPLNSRWTGAAAVVGIAAMLGMIALGSRMEILGLFATIVASLAIHAVLDRVRRGKKATETPAQV
jgi:amino acid transporter